MLKCHLNQCPHLHAIGESGVSRCGLESNEHAAWRLWSAGDRFLFVSIPDGKSKHLSGLYTLKQLPRNELIKTSWKAHSTSVPLKQILRFHLRKITQLNNGISAAVPSNLV